MLLSCGDALIDFLPVKAVDGRDAVVPVVGGCTAKKIGMRSQPCARPASIIPPRTERVPSAAAVI